MHKVIFDTCKPSIPDPQFRTSDYELLIPGFELRTLNFQPIFANL
jgi:hypothetical protein